MSKRLSYFVVAGKTASADQWAGLMMIAALGFALFCVNSPLKPAYDLFQHTQVVVSFGDFVLHQSLLEWINEGLMAFFFLSVTLEIKREVLEGHLSGPRQMLLPVIAAIGGIMVPAGMYLMINQNTPELMHGWAIPTATDIALSLGILSLLGSRVPLELKLFLAALAIFDDLGGILIIALFYGSQLTLGILVLSLLGIVGLFVLNRFAVSRASLYMVIGFFLWLTFQESGIHPTIAGVAVGLALPLRLDLPRANIPLLFVEKGLHFWVAFFVVPLFAFFNAGIDLSDTSIKTLGSPVTLGIMVGLVIGKPVGILGFAWLSNAIGLTTLADHVNWRLMTGVALLGGMGFTMALFFNSLAFSGNGSLEMGRVAILTGSLVSGFAGFFWLRYSLSQSQS
ncbi:MAG: Na+/H+ antiporter NhaA [Rhodospirillales bacterium]|nr:Na+/H+ antiporter NhaA [Rhodospirillales bacterium]